MIDLPIHCIKNGLSQRITLRQTGCSLQQSSGHTLLSLHQLIQGMHRKHSLMNGKPLRQKIIQKTFQFLIKNRIFRPNQSKCKTESSRSR